MKPKKTILCVDDNEQALSIRKIMLETRGYRVVACNNAETALAAFRRAVALGATFIETDLQLTRDTRLVAIHDDTLDRTTNGRGKVHDLTLNELRRLDAGSWFLAPGGLPRTAAGFPLMTPCNSRPPFQITRSAAGSLTQPKKFAPVKLSRHSAGST